MKDLKTASVLLVVFLLTGTELCPCSTHAVSLFNRGDDVTPLNIGKHIELSRLKRQSQSDHRTMMVNNDRINRTTLMIDGRRSRIAPLPSAPFSAEYLEKSLMIFHAHQILYGPLWEIQGQFPNNNRDNSFDLSKVLNYLKNYRNFNVNNLTQNLKKNFPGFERFQQMYHMRNEISHQSYSVACFDSDRQVLIAVAKYLDGAKGGTIAESGGSGGWMSSIGASPSIRNRQTLELAITLALRYRGIGSSSTSTATHNQCSRPASITTSSAMNG